MQHKTWTTIDKVEWGAGPWQEEPDKEQWEDKTTGLACLIKRNPSLGGLCGYVGVPPDHPLYGVPMEDTAFAIHGGITFSDFCQEGPEDSTICHVPEPGEPEPLFWYGFDAAHTFDYQPAYYSRYNFEPMEGEIYRDAEYIRLECAKLASQLANFA